MKFKSRGSANDSSLMVLDVQADMDPIHRSLHEKMRDLSIKRQNGTALRQKVKWALYEEKHFKRLIEDIIDLVNDLVEVFPAAEQVQRELCEVEASEIGTSESLAILKSIASSQDKELETAIAKALKSNVSMHILHGVFFESSPAPKAVGPAYGTTITARSGRRWEQKMFMVTRPSRFDTAFKTSICQVTLQWPKLARDPMAGLDDDQKSYER